jgi:hypothetical protein
MGLLAANGLTLAGPASELGAAAALCISSLAVAAPAVASYSGGPAPAYRALDEIRERLAVAASPPVVAMHYSVRLATRGEPIGARVLQSPVRNEWLELVKYWRAGGSEPVWFLASSRRTDLMLIDPRSRSIVKSYRSPAESRTLMAGTRPRSVDWVEIRPPGWVALDGWAMTPEIRGATLVADRSRGTPATQALIRRRPDEVSIMLGGRNLGGPCATGAVIVVSIDGREVQRFATHAGETFARIWRLPAGTLDGTGAFAHLTIAAEDRSDLGQQVDVAFEQFDVQGPGQAVAALVSGWFEPEYDTREAMAFRWMSDRAVIQADGFDRDIVLRLRGAASSHDFAVPSVLVIRVGDTELATRSVGNDFTIDVPVPATLLGQAGDQIEVEASQAFVPHERVGNGDRRALALRVYGVDVLTARTDARSAG